MRRPSRYLPFFALCASIAVAGSKGPLEVGLRFDPQEKTTAPVLGAGFSDHTASLEVRDGRPVREPALIGEGTFDDERSLDIRTADAVADFVDGVIREVAVEWGIPIEGGAERRLVATVTRFWVSERPKPVGSRYFGDVHLTFRLEGRNGEHLWEAAVRGQAERYGRKRSAANCNEVLSDALKSVIAAQFDQPRLQSAWTSGRPAEPLGVAADGPRRVEPRDLLEELRGMLDRGYDAETLRLYVEQITLRAPLTAEELRQWKEAGIPEEVVKAALRRVE